MGLDDYTDSLEPGDRKEWYWPDNHQQQKIIIRIDGESVEQKADLADKVINAKNIKWNWSAPIEINQQGVISICIKQDTNRFNNRDAIKNLKVQRKLIDGTIYVIIEEEDETYPLYRIENVTDDIAVWYVEKD